MRSLAAMGVLRDFPDTDDFNSVLKTMSQRTNRAPHAERLLEEMIHDYTNGHNHACRPNRASFHSVLWAWARVGNDDALSRIEELLQRMEQLHATENWHVQPDSAAYNNLLHCLSRIATVAAAERAEVILQQLRARDHVNGLRVDASPVSYQCVIDAWIRVGNVDRAEAVLHQFYQECKSGKFVPYKKPFNTVANAFSATDASERAGAVWRWWDELQKEKMQPTRSNKPLQEVYHQIPISNTEEEEQEATIEPQTS